MKYVVKKIGMLILTLLIISLLAFLAFTIIPGDAALSALGMDAKPETVEALREELGLDRPVLERYFQWLVNALQGDFGQSFQYHLPVNELVASRMPATVVLAIYSFIFILLFSFPLGLIGTRKEHGVADSLITVITQIGMAIPPFFLGIVLTYVFGIVLLWFPVGEYVSYKDDIRAFLGYLILPAVAIAIPKISMLTRFIRSSVLTQKRMDYVRTARSKGNSEKRIMLKHVLINALIPTVTMLAMMVAEILAGSIVVEQVFNIPGLGRLLIMSISNRDYPVVQAIVVYIALAVVVMNTLADLLYRRLDPRLK